MQIVAREVLNQRLCFHHPHIIQFREVFLTPDHFAIVSEYAQGGDLADYIDRHQLAHKSARMTETNSAWLFHQLVTGVNFCHQVMQCLDYVMIILHGLLASLLSSVSSLLSCIASKSSTSSTKSDIA